MGRQDAAAATERRPPGSEVYPAPVVELVIEHLHADLP